MIMFFRLVALVLITSTYVGQLPSGPPLQSNVANNPSSQTGGTIAVPQGSVVALKLISTIKSKSTHAGDPVRAAVAFPLAIDARVAIPAGTYVEGVVDKVNAHPARGDAPTVQLRFTRLLFSNGYLVPLVATNTQASVPVLNDPRRMHIQLADARDGVPYLGEGFLGQNPTQPPPLPSMGPSPGALAGIGIGAGVGILVLGLVVGHHRASSTDFVLFDSGWQFQMALQEPLSLDAAQVTAAAAIGR
jgi:hypothetical protein